MSSEHSGLFFGTGGETRTRKGLPPEDFESSASTIPPLRREESFLVKAYFKVNRILGENLKEAAWSPARAHETPVPKSCHRLRPVMDWPREALLR